MYLVDWGLVSGSMNFYKGKNSELPALELQISCHSNNGILTNMSETNRYTTTRLILPTFRSRLPSSCVGSWLLSWFPLLDNLLLLLLRMNWMERKNMTNEEQQLKRTVYCRFCGVKVRNHFIGQIKAFGRENYQPQSQKHSRFLPKWSAKKSKEVYTEGSIDI